MKRILFKTFLLSFVGCIISADLQSAEIVERQPIPIEIIENEDIDAAKKAIEQAYDINGKYPKKTKIKTDCWMTDAMQNTPLIIGIILNKMKMVEFLLASGADVNMKGYEYNKPLTNAINHFYNSWGNFVIDPKIIDLLLEHPCLDLHNEYDPYLHIAAQCERYSKAARDNHKYYLVKKVLAKMNQKNNIEFCKEITKALEYNVNYPFCPLFVRLLLEGGATIDKLNVNESILLKIKKINDELIQAKNKLFLCTEKNETEEVVQILLNYPELINMQNDIGETIMLRAVLLERFQLIKNLFESPLVIEKPNLLVDQDENGNLGPNNPVIYAEQLMKKVYDKSKLTEIINYLKEKQLCQQIQFFLLKFANFKEKAANLVSEYL